MKTWILEGTVIRKFKGPALKPNEEIVVIEKVVHDDLIQILEEKITRLENELDRAYEAGNLSYD